MFRDRDMFIYKVVFSDKVLFSDRAMFMDKVMFSDRVEIRNVDMLHSYLWFIKTYSFTYYNIRIPISTWETSSFIACIRYFLQNAKYTTFYYHIKYIIQVINHTIVLYTL